MKKLLVAATICLFAGVYSASAQNANQTPARHADIQKAQHVEQVVVPANASGTKNMNTQAAATTTSTPATEQTTTAKPEAGKGKACCKKSGSCCKKEGEPK